MNWLPLCYKGQFAKLLLCLRLMITHSYGITQRRMIWLYRNFLPNNIHRERATKWSENIVTKVFQVFFKPLIHPTFLPTGVSKCYTVRVHTDKMMLSTYFAINWFFQATLIFVNMMNYMRRKVHEIQLFSDEKCQKSRTVDDDDVGEAGVFHQIWNIISSFPLLSSSPRVIYHIGFSTSAILDFQNTFWRTMRHDWKRDIEYIYRLWEYYQNGWNVKITTSSHAAFSYWPVEKQQ